MYKAPRGTFDTLPQDQHYRSYVLANAVALCQLYGYERLDTPIFEDYELFGRSSAGGTDIVEKEMYVFEDRSHQKLALRPEGTAPVCRAYLEHGMYNLPQPVRLYYFGPTFRYERPQAGRYRQHHQFGCEAVGDADPALDAEVIEMARRFLLRLGITGFSTRLHSIGCKECQPRYKEALREHYRQHVERLCSDCRLRLTKNPLRLLDCKRDTCQEVAATAPQMSGFLCDRCKQHFEAVQAYLEALGIDYVLDSKLVRGLDYYTRTVFEMQPVEEASQSALVGGGRYDNLVEQLGGKPTPGVGFACGVERIVLSLKKHQVPVPSVPFPTILLASVGEQARPVALKVAAQLRDSKLGVVIATGRNSLRSQLRLANSLGVRYTLIIGADELETGTVAIRDMQSNTQEAVPLAGLPSRFQGTSDQSLRHAG